MCTVTFWPRRRGYALAMNRDEQIARARGLAPKRHTVAGRTALYPSEPGGGTWIALNDAGATLALINWYAVTARVERAPVSRGEVVRAALLANRADETDRVLARLPLPRINPFRLIGVFPATAELVEWRWNLKTLARRRHRWQARQWISSGYDEPGAQRARSAVFRAARRQRDPGSLYWLRHLHASHRPERGPYSTCMHRPDAATVSYTEMAIAGGRAAMRHCNGPPCRIRKDAGFNRATRLVLRRASSSG